MKKKLIAFTAHSRAAAFVSPEQPVHSFESLATLPSEYIHSQVGGYTDWYSGKIAKSLRS